MCLPGGSTIKLHIIAFYVVKGRISSAPSVSATCQSPSFRITISVSRVVIDFSATIIFSGLHFLASRITPFRTSGFAEPGSRSRYCIRPDQYSIDPSLIPSPPASSTATLTDSRVSLFLESPIAAILKTPTYWYVARYIKIKKLVSSQKEARKLPKSYKSKIIK